MLFVQELDCEFKFYFDQEENIYYIVNSSNEIYKKFRPGKNQNDRLLASFYVDGYSEGIDDSMCNVKREILCSKEQLKQIEEKLKVVLTSDELEIVRNNQF